MNQGKKQKVEEFYLKDILAFLMDSKKNILKSSLVCLIIGTIYYITLPKMYEASAIIKLLNAENETIEPLETLSEQIKLPNYFSKAALQVCNFGGNSGEFANSPDKFKTLINKKTNWLTVKTMAQSKNEASACLTGLIAEIKNDLTKKSNLLIEAKKIRLHKLNQKIQAIEEISNLSISTKEINKKVGGYLYYENINPFSSLGIEYSNLHLQKIKL